VEELRAYHALYSPLFQRREPREWAATYLHGLRQLAEQVTKDDGTPLSPQYLNDIELHHRVPTPHVLREFARVLELDADTLLATAGAADVVVREYVASHPEHAEAVIRLFRAAQQQEFHHWHILRQHIERGNKGSE
jgi:transcriptional regulator with XRE-family HTH domain